MQQRPVSRANEAEGNNCRPGVGGGAGGGMSAEEPGTR